MRASTSPALRGILENAVALSGHALKELTVLSPQVDPYRFDSPDAHRNGKWFAEVVERLVGSVGTIHLRGLHYRLVAAGDVIRPDQPLPYVNTEEAWLWLSNKAAKAGRWLGYVPFERIVDERNAPPEIFVPEMEETKAYLTDGETIDELPSRGSAVPQFCAAGFDVAQPYRLDLDRRKNVTR